MKLHRPKRLPSLLLAGVVLIVAGHFLFPLLNRQQQHLNAVRDHIALIRPEWDAFRASNPEFNGIRLFGYTAGDGMFGAVGFVSSTQQIQKLPDFMSATRPPRPVSTYLVRVMQPDE